MSSKSAHESYELVPSTKIQGYCQNLKQVRPVLPLSHQAQTVCFNKRTLTCFFVLTPFGRSDNFSDSDFTPLQRVNGNKSLYSVRGVDRCRAKSVTIESPTRVSRFAGKQSEQAIFILLYARGYACNEEHLTFIIELFAP
jgi:hypothetical protein